MGGFIALRQKGTSTIVKKIEAVQKEQPQLGIENNRKYYFTTDKRCVMVPSSVRI